MLKVYTYHFHGPSHFIQLLVNKLRLSMATSVVKNLLAVLFMLNSKVGIILILLSSFSWESYDTATVLKLLVSLLRLFMVFAYITKYAYLLPNKDVNAAGIIIIAIFDKGFICI